MYGVYYAIARLVYIMRLTGNFWGRSPGLPIPAANNLAPNKLHVPVSSGLGRAYSFVSMPVLPFSFFRQCLYLFIQSLAMEI